MSMADENRAIINGALDRQLEVDALFPMIEDKLDEILREIMPLGLTESSDSNIRPVIQMIEAAKSEANMTRATITEIRGRLLDWRDRL